MVCAFLCFNPKNYATNAYQRSTTSSPSKAPRFTTHYTVELKCRRPFQSCGVVAFSQLCTDCDRAFAESDTAEPFEHSQLLPALENTSHLIGAQEIACIRKLRGLCAYNWLVGILRCFLQSVINVIIFRSFINLKLLELV